MWIMVSVGGVRKITEKIFIKLWKKCAVCPKRQGFNYLEDIFSFKTSYQIIMRHFKGKLRNGDES